MFKTIAALLLLSPLLVACGSPPELDFQTREEAFDYCMALVGENIEQIDAEKALIKEKPHLFDSDRDDYYDNFIWSGVHTDGYTKRAVSQGYCEPKCNTKWKDRGYFTGVIEWIEEPNDGSVAPTKVDLVSRSNIRGTSFPWPSCRPN